MRRPVPAHDTMLLNAQRLGREEYVDALAMARHVEHVAAAAGDRTTAARAATLQGTLLLAQGRIDAAGTVAARLELAPLDESHPALTVAMAAFRAQLAFFLGAYREAITNATAAIVAADADGDPVLRADARRGTCIVLGNLHAPCLGDVLVERLALATAARDPWEQAISRNDLACYALDGGRRDEAQDHIDRAVALAGGIRASTPGLNTAIAATHAQILLARGRHAQAATRAVGAVRDLLRSRSRDPYLLAMTSVVAAQSLADDGRIDEAGALAHGAIERLGESLPMARSAILATLADALRRAGRTDEAYGALAASVDLERQAARQFARLQDDLDRAVLEQRTARIEAARLRDEADRDWLTGLHNRRYLSRLHIPSDTSVGVVLVDLDDFKGVNDRWGHAVGDRVLARVAQIIVAAARASDEVIRLGGDEFVVIMIGADRDRAADCAHRLQTELAAEPWRMIGGDARIGVSVGVSAGPAAASIDDLIARSDRSLYVAKESGGGRVAVDVRRS